MSRRERLAARLPWTRLAELPSTVIGRLDELAEARWVATAQLGRQLAGRLDALEQAQVSATAQLHALAQAQASATAQLGALEATRGARDARLLDLARRRKAQLTSREFHTLVREVQQDDRTLLGVDRLYVLWQAVRNTIALGLPVLEIGTFRGGSARFLAAALRELAGEDRELHVVDTFAGHDAADTSPLEPAHEAGRFAETSYEDVSAYLGGFPLLSLHRARFPDGADAYVPARVGLVHLDVDLYAPTSAALTLLADRAVPGTVFVVDDFGAPKTPGVLRAVHEFLAAGHPFQIWDVDTEQAVLVRR